MEDARYKVVAIEMDGPRGNGPLQSVLIEREDRRCCSLVDRGMVEMEDHRCRTVTVQTEDPRCQSLHLGW